MILSGLSKVREYLENQEKSGNLNTISRKSGDFTKFVIKNVKEKCPVIDTWM